MTNDLKKKKKASKSKGVIVMTLTKEQLMRALNLPLDTKVWE